MVTKEELLARAQDGRIKPISVDGLELHTRRLGLGERVEIGNRARKGEPAPPHEYLAICLCNPDGSPLFTLEEAQAFCDADGVLAEKIAAFVFEHAGMTAPENAAKN